MGDNDFEQVMDTWADHETESTPDMHPTAEMYRLVRASRQREPVRRGRWALAGAVVAGLIVLAVAAMLLFPGAPRDQQVAFVGQRTGYDVEKGGTRKGPVATPDKSRGKGPAFFEQLVFQYQREGARFVESIDLQAPQDGPLSLTSADNYRLLLAPAGECYVYVFQLTASDGLTNLFPNETYSADRNPLQQAQAYSFPSEPNWFYLGETKGQERLYVVAALQPLQDLLDLNAQYEQAGDASARQAILVSLVGKLDAHVEAHNEEAAGWVFVFDHR